MEKAQNEMLDEIMDSGVFRAGKVSNDNEATVSRLEPIMKQFITWQRLMEVNNEIKNVKERGTKRSANLWEELDFYAGTDPEISQDEIDDYYESVNSDDDVEPMEIVDSPSRTMEENIPSTSARQLRSSTNSAKNDNSPASTPPVSSSSSGKKPRGKAATEPKKFKIIISAEGMQTVTEEYAIDKTILIGRCDPNVTQNNTLDLNLANYLFTQAVRKVSHKHAEIQVSEGTHFIQCLGRNGMQINGEWIPKMQRVPLSGDQTVTMGPFSLVFKIS